MKTSLNTQQTRRIPQNHFLVLHGLLGLVTEQRVKLTVDSKHEQNVYKHTDIKVVQKFSKCCKIQTS